MNPAQRLYDIPARGMVLGLSNPANDCDAVGTYRAGSRGFTLGHGRGPLRITVVSRDRRRGPVLRFDRVWVGRPVDGGRRRWRFERGGCRDPERRKHAGSGRTPAWHWRCGTDDAPLGRSTLHARCLVARCGPLRVARLRMMRLARPSVDGD